MSNNGKCIGYAFSMHFKKIPAYKNIQVFLWTGPFIGGKTIKAQNVGKKGRK